MGNTRRDRLRNCTFPYFTEGLWGFFFHNSFCADYSPSAPRLKWMKWNLRNAFTHHKAGTKASSRLTWAGKQRSRVARCQTDCKRPSSQPLTSLPSRFLFSFLFRMFSASVDKNLNGKMVMWLPWLLHQQPFFFFFVISCFIVGTLVLNF